MTAQISEKLIIDGVMHDMNFCPPLPPDHSKLNIDVRHEPMKTTDVCDDAWSGYIATWTDEAGVEHSAVEDMIIFSTACWRQYVGTWEIKDGLLFLVGLDGRFRLAKSEPLFADWFTGTLRIPMGQELLYVHMGFGTVYEQELHILVERGRVTGRRVRDNRSRQHDERTLGWANLPGNENRFPGDSDFE